MNLRHEYTIKRIIKETVSNNKDKSLNEIKRMVKAQLRVKFDEEIASKIGSEAIIEVITSEGVLKPNRKPTGLTTKKVDKGSNEKER